MFRPVRIPLTVLAISALLGAAIIETLPSTFAAAPGAPAAGAPGATPGGRAGRGGARGPVAPPGPPAPVPPEVTQPTAAQVAQINDAIKQFVQNDKSSSKDLLQKYEPLLELMTPRPVNPAITPTQTQQRQGPRHLGFVETAKKGNIDLLFEGDSITDWWIQNGGQPTFDKYFGTYKTANFAIAGDTTQGVLWGLQNGESQGPTGFQPKAIMLMIGTNNLGPNTPAEIAEGVGAIILENRKDFPDAKILLLAIFPRGLATDINRPKIAQINKIISKLDDQKHVFYMDIGSKFLDPESGNFLPDTFLTDNLHPQKKGYDIWGTAVIDKLKDFLK